MGKRERKARERERKRNIVALLLLLLLRRTAATVLEHVLPVLFALSFLGPTHTHLAHICALLLGLLGLLRVPDERVFAILVLVVVARAVAANKTSSRVDADEKGLRTMQILSSRLWGKPSRREEDEEEEKEESSPKAERERERKTRNAKAHSKHHPFSARAKAKEREREKRSPSEERSRNCRFCGRFPGQIHPSRKENITREKRARASFREII